MEEHRAKKALGILLVVLGALLLLVNLGFLWFGWGVVWPLFPFVAGVLMMKLYASQRRPSLLFGGLVLIQLGLFFFVFTVGAVDWGSMSLLWPFLILIPGIALVAVAATGDESASTLIVGLSAVAAAVVGFWVSRGGEGARVFGPVIRWWPVALVVAGAMIYRRARRPGEGGS